MATQHLLFPFSRAVSFRSQRQWLNPGCNIPISSFTISLLDVWNHKKIKSWSYVFKPTKLESWCMYSSVTFIFPFNIFFPHNGLCRSPSSTVNNRTKCAVRVHLIIFLLMVATDMFVIATDASVMWHGTRTRPLKALLDVTKLLTKDALFCTPCILHTLIHKMWDYPAPYRWSKLKFSSPPRDLKGVYHGGLALNICETGEGFIFIFINWRINFCFWDVSTVIPWVSGLWKYPMSSPLSNVYSRQKDQISRKKSLTSSLTIFW